MPRQVARRHRAPAVTDDGDGARIDVEALAPAVPQEAFDVIPGLAGRREMIGDVVAVGHHAEADRGEAVARQMLLEVVVVVQAVGRLDAGRMEDDDQRAVNAGRAVEFRTPKSGPPARQSTATWMIDASGNASRFQVEGPAGGVTLHGARIARCPATGQGRRQGQQQGCREPRLPLHSATSLVWSLRRLALRYWRPARSWRYTGCELRHTTPSRRQIHARLL